MVTKGFFSSLSPVQQEAALAYDGPENHGPDFFAENANKSEHHAESAYCSDHIGDADKMVSAGLPSEEAIADEIQRYIPTFHGAREASRAILDLIRPAFEAKEQEIERYEAMIKCEQDAAIHWCGEAAKLNDRALSAESKHAQAVEALDLYRDAVRIDVKMDGPLFMGANSSALKRAWEADRAAARGEKT